MSIRAEAEENLRVIRSLMEKATVYSAISAPGALVGGLGAILVAVGGALASRSEEIFENHTFRFLVPWLGLLVVVTVVNLVLLARDAARRGEAFVSPGMRLALRAMLPGLAGGGLIAVPLGFSAAGLLARLWVLFYGISLLAASHFAPKSICWLGRAFFAMSALSFLKFGPLNFAFGPGNSLFHAHILMGATFGVFHLIYAACVWPRKSAA